MYYRKPMNTQLQKLFEGSNLSDKDKFEINQIFELLPPDKKQNLLNNFDILAFRIEQMQREIELERRILVWDIFRDVKDLYTKYN